MAESPTPIPELNLVLAALAESAAAVLGGNLVGAYLQGSFAAGGWDAHSDVDFIIAVRRDVTGGELPALQAMHGRLHDMPVPWARRLDGSYLPLAILRRADPERTPLLYLDNGARSLVRSTHDNSLVVRWVLREHGIALAGPPPSGLIDPVPDADLKVEVRATMRDWGAELLADAHKLDNGWYQPFAVLSYCRMLHTLASGRIESKPAGAAWALSALPEPWAGLIQRAWANRGDAALQVRQPADPADLRMTGDFVRYAIQLAGEAR